MTKLSSYRCDICGMVFAGESAYNKISLSLPTERSYEKEIRFNFEDICWQCRTDLVRTIGNFLESKLKKD